MNQWFGNAPDSMFGQMLRQIASRMMTMRLMYVRLTGRLLAVACLMAMSTLQGCMRAPEERAMVDDYLWRLANVLEQEQPDLSSRVFSYPEKRGMTLSVSTHGIDLLDFLSMTGCQLQITAAQKNSGLGRVMMASQQLLYQWQFLQDSESCLPHLARTDPELYRQLQAVVEVKRQELARYAWLALWAGPEMRTYFGATQQWLSEQQQILLPEEDLQLLLKIAGFTRSMQRLAMASEIQNNAQSVGADMSVERYREPLEQVLYRLSQSNRGGEVLTTVSELTRLLNQGTTMLAEGRAKPVCPQGRVTAQAKILHTVFLKFYIGQVQPYLAFVHKAAEGWFEQIAALRGAFDIAEPAAFHVFGQIIDNTRNDGLWQQYKVAVQAHTRAWQAILGDCGLMPGQ